MQRERDSRDIILYLSDLYFSIVSISLSSPTFIPEISARLNIIDVLYKNNTKVFLSGRKKESISPVALMCKIFSFFIPND